MAWQPPHRRYVELTPEERKVLRGSGNFYFPHRHIRDRNWTHKLRQLWPDYTRIEIPTKLGDDDVVEERFNWCQHVTDSKFFVNGTGNIWYFEHKKTAVAFKLIFGGSQ